MSEPASGSLKDARPQLRDLPAPEPAAGTEVYLQERERALVYSAERRSNYEKYVASSRRGAHVDYMPIKLDIENIHVVIAVEIRIRVGHRWRGEEEKKDEKSALKKEFVAHGVCSQSNGMA